MAYTVYTKAGTDAAIAAQTISDATTSTKGAVKLAGDLGGTADSPTVPALAAKADLVGGVVPSAQLPSIALTNAVTVASQSAMLALTTSQVQPGDVAVRTDGAGTFILTATDPSVLANWVRLNAPTDAVTTVNGYTGTVVLAKADVGLGNVDNTSDVNKPVSTAQQTALNLKANTTALPGAATTSTAGIVAQATNTQAVTGTDDGHYTTPLGVKSAIDARNYTAVTIDGTDQPTLDIDSTAISASDVGLGNVTNTSDANKPVSTAQQTALDLKADKALTIVSFTNLTIDTSHAGKLLNCTNASAAFLTIPLNSAQPFPIGTTVNIYVSGAGQLTVGWTAGVTLNSRASAYKSAGQFALMSVTKVDTDTWVLTGDVSA